MITIYHNPQCGTSRNTLGLIRNTGAEPQVIEYLKTPLTKAELVVLLGLMDMTPRQLLREKEKTCRELGLGDPAKSDDELLDAMAAHPILVNRPIVVTPVGVKLCRPSELVLDILTERQRGAFAKEDGEKVVDEFGNRIAGPENGGTDGGHKTAPGG
jgi:arsenate reductase